ncbi:hypothetical protein Hanom_Chr11g01048061 [Helianthus anomalus]
MYTYFKTRKLDRDFTIQFGNNHMWTLKIDCLFEEDYFIVDFSEIVRDLFLIFGDLIVIELVGDYTFSIQLSRHDGLQSPIPKVAFPHTTIQLHEGSVNVTNHSYKPDITTLADEGQHVYNAVDDGSDQELLDNHNLVADNSFERFPKDFNDNVHLADMVEMNVVTKKGFSMTMALRSERSCDNHNIRYAFRGWEKFMGQAGYGTFLLFQSLCILIYSFVF